MNMGGKNILKNILNLDLRNFLKVIGYLDLRFGLTQANSSVLFIDFNKSND